MSKLYTQDEVRRILRLRVSLYGSQTAVAEEVGCKPQFINRVLHGNKAPSGNLLAWLGFEKLTRYGLRDQPKGDTL